MPIYEPVTNTYKINKHFALCKDEPLIIQQGSQGASKTISDLMLIIDWFRNNPKKEITICSAEKTKLIDTAFNDLKKICLDWGIWDEFKWNDNKSVLSSKSSKTGFIEFIGLDKDDIGKGRRRDLIYINEVNKVPYNKFFDISQRAKKVICDYNPDKRFYIHELINDINFIKLDFTGNEKLSKEEIRNILGYKKKGYLLDENDDFVLDANGNRTILNQFFANKWQVYGEGNLGQVEGRIYNWKSIPYAEFLNLNKESYFGVDWGTVDPFAIVEAKYHDGNLYIHEHNYASENEIRRSLSSMDLHSINGADEDGLVSWLFQKLNIPKKKIIVCDNNRPNKIVSLRRVGYESAVAVGGKSKLLDRIQMLQGLNIYFTDTSKNIELEQENYCYQKDKFGVVQEEPIDQDNHTIDAVAYVVQKMFDFGVIKKI